MPKPRTPAISIALVAFDQISPFHLSVPCLVFGEDWQELGAPVFDLRVCAISPGPLRTSAGFDIVTRYGLEALKKAAIIIVPSWHDVAVAAPAELLDALRRAERRGALIVGLCLGAFVLAEAGLLEGKAATTHWHWADEFAQRFPGVKLDADVLYVADGNVMTSAGVAAGLDCCLYLLHTLCGAEVANRVARRLVVAPHRHGGQAQFIEQPVSSSRQDGRLAGVMEWAGGHLGLPHSVDSLAGKAAMSRRTFTRHFRSATGTTVNKWLSHQRLAQAQRLLETTDLSVEIIAVDSGFGSAISLRKHFSSILSTSPSEYRRQFRHALAPAFL